MTGSSRRRKSPWLLVGAAVLVAAMFVRFVLFGSIVDTREAQARSDLRSLHQALHIYRARTGSDPTAAQGLDALCGRKPDEAIVRCTDGHLLFIDPWLRPYVYRAPDPGTSARYALYSSGPNAIDDHGSGDDVIAAPAQ